MNKKGQGWLIAIVVIVVILFMFGSWIAGSYNSLVGYDTNVENQWGKVQSSYQRRADLIPNLVAVAKAYSDFESDTLIKVTQARASIGSAKTPEELDAANAPIENVLSRLLVVVEKYPELKANTLYMDLQVQLEGTENRINTERNYYNDRVKEYKVAVRSFPSNIIAGIFGFAQNKWEMFEAKDSAQDAPDVSGLFNKNL